MADNSKQFRWITVLAGNLAAMFREVLDVLVGGNLFWYPREGFPDEVQAPDVFVVFGRPKGDRRSYQQWREDNVPMTVVFEVLSPKNTPFEMANKLAFYDEHGVEEYYVFDPDANELLVYHRGRAALRLIRQSHDYVSPRLGIRFDLSGPEMVVYRPDGERFLTFEELKALQEREHQQRIDAERRADKAEHRADAAEKKVARLAQLSRKARLGQASAEELQQLERLEAELNPPS